MIKSVQFDVVIPTYNNLHELKACLEGLAKQTFRSFRVLVCVDGSTDGTLEFLSSMRFPFTLKILTHAAGQQKGRASTRNLCLKHLRSKYLCMVDSDLVPAPELLEKHFGLLQDCDCISMGRIVFTNSKTHCVAAYVQERGQGKYKHGETIPAYYFNTQNVAFNSDYFIKAGGQDTVLDRSYGGDDSELGYRLWKTFRVPAVTNTLTIGYSTEKKDLASMLRQLRCFGAVNLRYIRKKHPDLKELFGCDWMESSSLRAKLARVFLSESLLKNIEGLTPHLPKWIRNPIIHCLVFLNIGLGYRSAEPKGA